MKNTAKEIQEIFEKAKTMAPEFKIFCHPKEYSPAQKLVSSFIEFFIRDSKVLWSHNQDNLRRVSVFYTDTKTQGAFLQGLKPEENWDQIASHFFHKELKTILNSLPYENMKPESQKFLIQVLEQSKDILKISDTTELVDF